MNSENIVDNTPISLPTTIENRLNASSGTLFPTLYVDRPSAKLVCLLKDAAFSKHGEMTGLSTYLYQSWITSPQYPTLASSLQEISMVEMTHLEALANAIVAFGGTPNYSNSNGAYWSGNYVNKCKDPRCFLQNNIASERRAIADYRSLQAQTTNQSLIALLDKIISDELLHIQIFESYLPMFNV